jgi:cell division protein FtsL
MRLLSLRVVVVLCCVFASGVALFATSQNVQRAENRLAEIEGDIQKTEATIHVLRAEWAYLNRPQRLEVLARDSLGMDVPSPHNVVHKLDEIDAQVQNGLQPAFYNHKANSKHDGGEL